VTFRVRGLAPFWQSVDALDEDDPRKPEVYQVAFRLLEDGPALSDARAISWIWGQATVDGYSIDLPGGDGFIAYAPIPEVPDLIYLMNLVLF